MFKHFARAVSGLAALLLLIGVASQGKADPISVFSTGVDGSGAVLPGGSIDPHYTVNGGSAFVIGNPASVGWVGNTGTSAWISPDPTTLAGTGTFTYTTTFDLTGFFPNTAVLVGNWSADDEASMFLNGTLVAQTAPTASSPWTFLDSFIVKNGFVSGINTLEFVVPNTGGPTGLQVDIRGTASVVPEPVSLLLIGGGSLPLLGLLARRRKK